MHHVPKVSDYVLLDVILDLVASTIAQQDSMGTILLLDSTNEYGHIYCKRGTGLIMFDRASFISKVTTK